MTLVEKMNALKKQANTDVIALQSQLCAITDRLVRDLKSEIFQAGHKPCHECHMTGAVERFDSGYMRRFGLREWDGCEACGGEGDQRGRGYI